MNLPNLGDMSEVRKTSPVSYTTQCRILNEVYPSQEAVWNHPNEKAERRVPPVDPSLPVLSEQPSQKTSVFLPVSNWFLPVEDLLFSLLLLPKQAGNEQRTTTTTDGRQDVALCVRFAQSLRLVETIARLGLGLRRKTEDTPLRLRFTHEFFPYSKFGDLGDVLHPDLLPQSMNALNYRIYIWGHFSPLGETRLKDMPSALRGRCGDCFLTGAANTLHHPPFNHHSPDGPHWSTICGAMGNGNIDVFHALERVCKAELEAALGSRTSRTMPAVMSLSCTMCPNGYFMRHFAKNYNVQYGLAQVSDFIFSNPPLKVMASAGCVEALESLLQCYLSIVNTTTAKPAADPLASICDGISDGIERIIRLGRADMYKVLSDPKYASVIGDVADKVEFVKLKGTPELWAESSHSNEVDDLWEE